MPMKPELVLPMTEKSNELILSCQWREFKVHKSVVCPQSSFFATACDGPFKESTTNTIEITDFDLDTVGRMIQYLYYKRYYINVERYREDIDDDHKKAHDNSQIEEAPDLELDENSALVLLHVRVNGIADYYDIPGLKDLANRNIRQILNESWSLEGFTDLIEEVLNSTCDEGLHEIIAESAATHITDLVEQEDFFKNGTINPFPSAVIKAMAKTYPKAISKLEESMKSSQSEAQSLKEELEDLRRRVDKLMLHTEHVKLCLNSECRAELSGSLDTDNGES